MEEKKVQCIVRIRDVEEVYTVTVLKSCLQSFLLELERSDGRFLALNREDRGFVVRPQDIVSLIWVES